MDICTWTPLDGMVMLRPQFEHLDAFRVQQKMGPRSTRLDDDDKKEIKAEDVNMTVKDTEDDEPQDDLYGGMAETLKSLRAMADEPWQRLEWVDSEVSISSSNRGHFLNSQQDDHAYAMWEETLVYRNAESAPKLVSDMTQEQYLDAISCPRIDPINKGRKIMRPSDADPDDFGLTTDEEKTPPMSRPKDIKTKYLIEATCREICGKPEDEHKQIAKFIQKSFRSNEKYAFLMKSHHLHRFFLWRLRQNKAKRGWSLKVLHEKNEMEENIAGRFTSDESKGLPDETSIRRESAEMEMQVTGEESIQSIESSKRRNNQRGGQKRRKGLG